MNGPTTGLPIDPCENCNTAAQLIIVLSEDKDGREQRHEHVECPECGMRGPKSENEAGAIGLWNKVNQAL